MSGLEIPVMAAIASAAATATGAAASYGQAKSQANIARATGDFNRREYDRAASEAEAAGHRAAQQQREKTERVISSQRAAAVKSGAGGLGDSEGGGDALGDVARRGAYLSELSIASGANKAAGLRGQGMEKEWEAQSKAAAADSAATASLIKGAFDTAAAGFGAYSKFGDKSDGYGRYLDKPPASRRRKPIDDSDLLIDNEI